MQLPNFRKVDNKFYLSGGWNNLPENIKILQFHNIKAVLDLQFLPDNSVYSVGSQEAMILHIKEELEKVGIDYKAIKLRDDEFNLNLEIDLAEGGMFLEQMEEKHKGEIRKPAKKVIQMGKRPSGILVKCAAGISRSPTMLINYLCETRRMSYLEALNYVRKNEQDQGVYFGASPNHFFVEHLKKKYK